MVYCGTLTMAHWHTGTGFGAPLIQLRAHCQRFFSADNSEHLKHLKNPVSKPNCEVSNLSLDSDISSGDVASLSHAHSPESTLSTLFPNGSCKICQLHLLNISCTENHTK